jgi:hypothetical protein
MFGVSVSVSGDVAMVGAYVFERQADDSWIEQ